MKLTKHAHACVVLEKDGHTLAIDAGAYTPTAAEAIASAEAVIITHDHPDHFDPALLTGDKPVYAPQSVIDAIGHGTVLTPGETVEIAGFTVQTYGGKHAFIWGTAPDTDNVALLIDGALYHPGDSYDLPGVPVDTLLVPTSGPWWKLGEAIDFVRAIAPRRAIQIHELMASDAGQGSSASMLGEKGFGGVPFSILPVGESVEV